MVFSFFVVHGDDRIHTEILTSTYKKDTVRICREGKEMTPRRNRKKEAFCPVEVPLSLLAGKWKAMIIYHLLKGKQRFNGLQREMNGITHRMLSQQLKEMEMDGLVIRTDYGEMPPKVEYSLSPLGKSLRPVLSAMHRWGERHGDALMSVRRRVFPPRRDG
jgi:DNA-binding HxlR family transcriptional regulator